jgi:hypothetical protein
LQDIGKLRNVYPLDEVLVIDKDGRGISDNAGEKAEDDDPREEIQKVSLHVKPKKAEEDKPDVEILHERREDGPEVAEE